MSVIKWDTHRLSDGERSALKRNAGIMLSSASLTSIEAFYRAQILTCGKAEESTWFAALCMECLWRKEDEPTIKPLPELLKSIYQDPEATESSRKRCTDFFDLYWSDDGFLLGKICSLVRIIRAKHPELMPDFQMLADDLSRWNHRDHIVQRKWLRLICQSEMKKKEEEKNAD